MEIAGTIVQFGRPDSKEFELGAAVQWVFEAADVKPSTRRTYAYAIRDFTGWAAGRPLNRAILVEYKNALRRRTDLSARTRNLYLAAARTLFRQFFVVGILPYDASKLVKSFSIGINHKRPPITDAQVRRAFKYARERGDPRLILILNLLYRQGLRQKELVDLVVDHFDEQSATLSILGKARDDRELIHLHPESAKAFRAYLDHARLRSGFVFPSCRDREQHIRVNALYRIVERVHDACNIPNSPHAWRKVFTSKLIESGMNLLEVQQFTRHKSVSQLKIYADRLSVAKCLPAFYAAFPSED